MPQPITEASSRIDLSQRFQVTTTVGASPAAGSETIIGTLTITDFGNLAVTSGILLRGWCSVTIGTSGVSHNLRIRQTNVSGTVIAATGALTATAGNLYAPDVVGFDSGAGVGTYVLTLTVGSGAAASTVSALALHCVVV